MEEFCRADSDLRLRQANQNRDRREEICSKGPIGTNHKVFSTLNNSNIIKEMKIPREIAKGMEIRGMKALKEEDILAEVAKGVVDLVEDHSKEVYFVYPVEKTKAILRSTVKSPYKRGRN